VPEDGGNVVVLVNVTGGYVLPRLFGVSTALRRKDVLYCEDKTGSTALCVFGGGLRGMWSVEPQPYTECAIPTLSCPLSPLSASDLGRLLRCSGPSEGDGLDTGARAEAVDTETSCPSDASLLNEFALDPPCPSPRG